MWKYLPEILTGEPCDIVASKGIPVVDALGTKGSWNHAPNEYAEVESLFTRAKLAAAFVINLKDDIQ